MYISVKALTGGILMAFAAASLGGTLLAQGLDDPLIAEGQLLFEETAGDAGCAMCHGMEATGDPDAGGVYIRGVSKPVFNAALNGAVPVMEFLDLSPHEKDAVFAYLQYLYIAPESQFPPEVRPGEEIFQRTAGGVGCQSCHGTDARGDYGPDISNRAAEDIHYALETVEDMGFLELTDEEIDQVAVYLNYLLEAAAN